MILTIGIGGFGENDIIMTRAASHKEVLVHEYRTQNCKVNMGDLSESAQNKIKRSVNEAVKAPAKGAEMLNDACENQRLFEVGVDETLNQFYTLKEKGEIKQKQIDAFTVNLSGDAKDLAEQYNNADVERRKKNLSYEAESIIVQFEKDATEEDIQSVVDDMGGLSYTVLNDIDKYMKDTSDRKEKTRLESLKAYCDVKIVSIDIARRQTTREAIKEYKQYAAVSDAGRNNIYSVPEEEVEENCATEPVTGSAVKAQTRSSEMDYTPYAKNIMGKDLAWQCINQHASELSKYKPRIAVIDTGLDIDNPDLCNMYTKDTSADVTRIDQQTGDYMTLVREKQLGIPTDYAYHGTAVSSIIAAESGNGVGFQGLGTYQGYNLMEILGVKATSRSNNEGIPIFDESNLIKAIIYSLAKGANVINMSLSALDRTVSNSMQKTIDFAYYTGTTVVVAAGNASSDHPWPEVNSVSPGSAKHVICVGYSDQNNLKAFNSCYGPMIDLLAPGDNVMITQPGGEVASDCGSSLAAPMVSTLAGMLYYCNIDNPEQIEATIKRGCTDIYESGWDQPSGHGIINMSKTINQIILDKQEPSYEYDVDRYIFDYVFYATAYPDLANAYGYNKCALYSHWKNAGINEGRDGTQTGFNVHEYASTLKLNNIIYVGKNTWKNYFYDYMFKLLAE